jgi:predicted transcriptional regulator
MKPSDSDKIVELTAAIVSAYVSNNEIAPGELTKLIGDVHTALQEASGAAEAEPETREPAVSVRQSVRPEHIVCLEDGKKFRSLKRHLKAVHGLTPDEYRQRWGLPSDYPMVAPNYSRVRSDMAKSMGLGRGQAPPRKRARARAR